MTNMEEAQDTLVYVIDENFRIVYSNDKLKKVFPEFKPNCHCYKLFSNNHTQCQNCPLRPENHGKSIRYNARFKKWFTVSAAPFDYPGVGNSHIVMANFLEQNEKNFLYNVSNASDYSELLELNYLNNSYNIAYHDAREHTETAARGVISTAVERLAKTSIHPDDKECFCNFWLLDRVHKEGIPDVMLAPRHGEFRKRKADGDYQWVQQIMIPIRQSSKNSIFVNSFYNVIDMPVSENDQQEPSAQHKLYNKKLFFESVDNLLRKESDNRRWSMIAIDLEKFKLYNEWYGQEAGDRLLVDFSAFLKELQDNQKGIAGYFDNDDFAFLTSYDEDELKQLYREIAVLIRQHSDKMNILPAFGIYEITDKNTPAFKAYDRANLACESVKGVYTSRVKKFDDKMLRQLESEYLLLSDIQTAFRNREFTFYLQPKCNMKNGKIVGAEALARWKSAEKGMISPAVFIPFLEKSGFIAELDTFIWEEVCKWQRSMLDRGAQTVPVSVNVSRTDLYSVDVPAYFCSLIEKYDLPASLIEIEITESAYAENDDLVNRTVNELRSAGFHILMDDFGSAYSSLNMLKDISVDTLKIDMRFLDFTDKNTARGIGILETICNMASILGLGIIVEGVETEEQRNHLLTMNCCYGQGYYFHRPLEIKDFERTIETSGSLSSGTPAEDTIERLYLKDLLGKDIFSEIMINNMLGAVVFYDVYENQINVIRYNEQYAALVGNKQFSSNTEIRFGNQLYQEDYEKIFQMFKDAKNDRHQGAETTIRRRRPDGTDMWLNLRTFFIHMQNGHAIYYSSASDSTNIYKANESLRFLNNDMPGGYYRHTNTADCEFTLISDRFLSILGYTRDEIREQFENKMINMIHPEDREYVLQNLPILQKEEKTNSLLYRILSKDGYISIVDQSRLVNYGGAEVFQGIILRGIDKLFKKD